MATLSVNPAALEGVFGWLEQNGGQPAQLWGFENGRPAALLAYSDGPGDGFGWSNWAAAARQDPSELAALFQQFGLQLEESQAAQLMAAFPAGVAAAPAPAQASTPAAPTSQSPSFLGRSL